MTEFLDSATVPLKLTPTGADVGPYTDSATVGLSLVPTSSEFHQPHWGDYSATLLEKWFIQETPEKWSVDTEVVSSKWAAAFASLGDPV